MLVKLKAETDPQRQIDPSLTSLTADIDNCLTSEKITTEIESLFHDTRCNFNKAAYSVCIEWEKSLKITMQMTGK